MEKQDAILRIGRLARLAYHEPTTSLHPHRVFDALLQKLTFSLFQSRRRIQHCGTADRLKCCSTTSESRKKTLRCSHHTIPHESHQSCLDDEYLGRFSTLGFPVRYQRPEKFST
ncbi:Uncharacterised protein [Vibrio cholerae]|uniref:Uncharacterized protein n=1 Tax=Vibrio cholerae TaxID=666 RepID=A0A655UXI3_VIBCL|nr:Uncharacterised protein [Vibrio cholerae]CSC11892.1 Uncharacterised protein [Vibrio cholerae]